MVFAGREPSAVYRVHHGDGDRAAAALTMENKQTTNPVVMSYRAHPST